MSDRPTRIAQELANHAADDLYADSIHEAAKALLGLAQAGAGKGFNLIEAGTEELAVTDGAAVGLTIPAGATGAVIQVKMDAGFEASALCITVDGTLPTLINSVKVQHYKLALIGNAPNHAGDPDELGNFQAIAQAGETARIRVLYYEPMA